MRRSLSAAVLLLGLAVGNSAAAAGGTLTDQAVSLVYTPTHWGSLPVADLTGVDAAGDPVHHSGWWYRAEGDTQEHPLPVPDSESYYLGRLYAVWNNLDGKGFRVSETTDVFDGEGPSGGFVSSLRVRNDNAVIKQFTAYHYLDADLAGGAAGDSGIAMTARFMKFSDGASRLSYRAGPFSTTRFQVAAYPSLRDALNDAALTELTDAGLPFGPDDATAAFQFGPVTISSGSSYALGDVSVTFNAPRDHVKGDDLGLGLTTLVGQMPSRADRFAQAMRRTSPLGNNYHFGAPPTNPSVAGMDDFDADFKDEPVFRDLVSGTAYVDHATITGAPTLPLNWKLSATGDFNADGKADILWRNTTSQKLVVWTMSGSTKVGNIIPSPDQAADANWEVAAAADFNGDANRDLLWYNQTSGKLVLWFMNASVVRLTGQFTTPASVGDNNWRALAVGDYGKGPGGLYDTQDIVWQNDTSKKIVVWFMDLAGTRTSGTFTSPDVLLDGWDLVGPR